MSVFAAVVRRLFAVSAILSLAACGGGGGRNNDAYSVSPLGITFVATQNGATPSPQQVSVTANSGTVYIRIDIAGMGIANVEPQFSPGSANGTITINPVSPTMSPGTYSSTVTVYGCADPYCTSSVAGSPKVINVTYTIQPRSGFSATPQSLRFSHLQSAVAPAPQTFALSDISGGSYAWSASINYLSGSGWLTVNGASQVSGPSLPTSLSVGINPLSSIGTYSAVIHVTGNGNAIDIPVSYTVRVPQVTAAPTSLTYSAISHDATTPATQSVTLGTEAGLPVSYSAVVVYGAGASGWLSAPATGSAPSSMTVGVNTTSLNAGTYTATLVLTTATQNLSIPVSYTVRAPQVTRSPTQLSFSAYRLGATPSAQSVTINTENGTSVPYTTSISYGVGASSWLSVPASGTAPGSLSVSVNTTNLNVGNYTAMVSILPGNGATAITVGITYQVQSATLTAAPGTLSYTINTSSVMVDLTKSVAIGDTGIPINWTVISSVPWLTVGTASGSTAGNGSSTTVPLNLVAVEIEKLAAGSHSGTVTFTYYRPDASVGAVQLPVTLVMNVPQVNFVSPYVAQPNISREVILRGSGFSSATGSEISFGSNTVSSYNIVSDTEIRVTHPALSAGSYPVSIPNQLNLNRTRANLVVVEPVQFSYTVLPTSLFAGRIIYDAERRAIYVVRYDYNTNINRIERIRYNAGSWITDALPNASLSDIALTPDGRELIATSRDRLVHIDPVSLTISWGIAISSAFSYPTSNDSFGQIAIGNDGVALLPLGYRGVTHNVLTKTSSLMPDFPILSCTRPGTAGDGSRIVFGQNCVTPSQLMYYYDVSSGQFVSTGLRLNVGLVGMDRSATRANIDGSIYDRQFNLEGTLGGGRHAMSQDDSRAYVYYFPAYFGAPGTIRAYDLNSRNGTGGFNQVGSDLNVPDSPGQYNVQLAITPDGRTLILTGDERVIIQPLP